MPLVVPGLSSTGDNQQNWMSKLAGKTIGDNHNEQSFAKKDLPANHRVVKEGDMATQDHDPNRMNVYVGSDGTVRKVDFK